VLSALEDLLVYEYDATIERGLPEAVVLPDRAEQIAAVVNLARRHGVPVTARGAGTGLSGGAIPCEGGIVIATARMNRILEIDPENRLALVEPGVVNLDISKAVAQFTTRLTPPARRPVPSAATWPRTPEGRTACATASPPTMSWA
jgi:glycolate oxidase